MSENTNGSGISASGERAREAALRRLVPEMRTALDNAPDVRAWPPSWHDDEWVDYFYHSSSLLTRDRDLSRVDRKSTRLNSSHTVNSYAVFCLKKKKLRQRQSAA